MTDTRLRWTITIVAVLLAAAHLRWPGVSLDATTMTLLAVAILPWLRALFKSLELPGGLKIEFQDVKKVSERADALGLVSPQHAEDLQKFSFQLIARTDPNLALAGLRIELERRLLQLAESRGLRVERKGIGRLLEDLNGRELIGGAERSVLSDLAGLLNSAVHGARVEPQAAEWALDVGPRILHALEQRAAAPTVRYQGIAEHW